MYVATSALLTLAVPAQDVSEAHRHTPLSGGDRKALTKELRRSTGFEHMLKFRSIEARARGDALIREALRVLERADVARGWP